MAILADCSLALKYDSDRTVVVGFAIFDPNAYLSGFHDPPPSTMRTFEFCLPTKSDAVPTGATGSNWLKQRECCWVDLANIASRPHQLNGTQMPYALKNPLDPKNVELSAVFFRTLLGHRENATEL